MMKNFGFIFVICCAALSAVAQNEITPLAFYKQQADALTVASNRGQRAYAKTLADNLGTWAAQHLSDENAPQALLTQARLYGLAQEKANALITLLKVSKLYPQISLANQKNTIQDLLQIVDEPARSADGLRAFNISAGADTAWVDREAAVLFALSKLPGNTLYAPACDAFESFFLRYPTYGQNDQVELWYGDLHRENGNYLAALSQYQKVAALYPLTPYRAASLRLSGDIYADHLNDTNRARALYNQVLQTYPDSNETGIVYKHMAILEENERNYDAALSYYDKAIRTLGSSPAAFEAYTGKADVYKKKKDFDSAYRELQQASTVFAGYEKRRMQALSEASQIARKNLRDDIKYTQSLEKILVTAPNASNSDEIMYNLGQAYERQNRTAQAVEMYKKVVLRHPDGKYAARAQGRINKLQK
ncbi:MAG: tetratricopeptide repeat protein [Elusimicrobiaceae bacterium]|nr:tetratricopeptide repeat protein [Elusimicrobiaceae bacterium]